jgi:hypothetical protein
MLLTRLARSTREEARMLPTMRSLVLRALLLLAVPVAAFVTGAAPAAKEPATLAGLREWNESRAESSRLLRELQAHPTLGKAAQPLATEWQALDRLMQKVQTLQSQKRLDGKAARAAADELGEQLRRIESAQENVRNKRSMDATAFQNFDQKSNQLMNMLTSVVKTMSELRGIGAGSRSGL